MRTYLNKEERNDLCLLAALAAHMDDVLERWKMLKEEHKYLATARTLVFKFISSVFNRVDDDLVDKLMRNINASEVVMLPTSEAKRKVENAKKEMTEDDVIVKHDVLLNLAEHALVGCENCERYYKSCDLRKVFIELGIEPYDYNPPENTCEYRIVK